MVSGPGGWDEMPTLEALGAARAVVEDAHREGVRCNMRCPGDDTCRLLRGLRAAAPPACVLALPRPEADAAVDAHAAQKPCGPACSGRDDCTRLDLALAVLMAGL